MDEAKILLTAKMAHEVNRIWCAHLGEDQPTWENAPEWQHESAKAGVRAALTGSTPEKQHIAWLEDKLANGWSYGPVKDANLKTHPCMTPYQYLPREQQIKDLLFTRVVQMMLEA